MTWTFSKDPVRIAQVVSTFVGAVVALLVGAGVIDEVAAGVAIGILTAASAAVQELAVRPATVPREPLEELATMPPSTDAGATFFGDEEPSSGTTFEPPPEV